MPESASDLVGIHTRHLAVLSPIGRLRKAAAAVRTPLGRRGLRHGVAAEPIHAALIARLEPRVVIDVGANRGQFALAALIGHPDVHVVSFEPLSGPRATYDAVLGHVDTVRVVPLALGASPGTASINISRSDDSSSLLRATERQTSTFPGSVVRTTETVTVSTLDTEIAEVEPSTLLKIDVQGFELEVLRGADRTLAACRWVMCEVSFLPLYDGQCTPGEVIAHLAERSFRLAAIVDTLSSGGEIVQADLLFENTAISDGG